MIIELNLTATTVSFDLRSSLPNQEKSSVKTPEKIKGLMINEPTITIIQIAEALCLTPRAIEKAVTKLKADGEIERKDGKKGGSWIVLK